MKNRLAFAFAFVLTLGCGSAELSLTDGQDVDGSPDAPLPDAPTMVTFHSFIFDNPIDLPFLAMQEGDQPWVLVPAANGTYTFMVPSGRYGIAWVCPEADTSFVRGWVL